MASIAILVGGPLVNALAFSGSNYLFSLLHRSGIDQERKHHDKAIEHLQAAQAEWSQIHTERLDWIKEELHRQNHAVQTFQDVDTVIFKCYRVTGKALVPLGPESLLSDFYTLSDGQKDHEIAFIILGMGAMGLVAYKLAN